MSYCSSRFLKMISFSVKKEIQKALFSMECYLLVEHWGLFPHSASTSSLGRQFIKPMG